MATKTIISAFTEAGVAKTGLSPVVDIWQVDDNTQVITSEAMTEIAGGFYKYSFTTQNIAKDYVFKCDAVTLNDYERYSYGVIENSEGLDYAIAIFTVDGVGETGLSTTVNIWQVNDNSLVVNSASMTEIASGFYKYNYTSFSNSLDYVVQCNGGATLDNSERYLFGVSKSNTNYYSLSSDIECVIEPEVDIVVAIEVG